MSDTRSLRVALIGDGGISRSVRATLTELADPGIHVTAVLKRGITSNEPLAVTDVDALLGTKPGVVIECAGHSAVTAHGETILRAGVTLVIVSAGALADVEVEQRLQAAAIEGGGRLLIASGALAGIDALAAARFGGLQRVRYRGLKPPVAWKGTQAETLLDLTTLTEPTVFYRGNARDAARAYPKNSNVAATIAMAGIGFDATEVELVADPTVERNVHELWFQGADGQFRTTSIGMPSRDNPKTSALTAHSVVRILTSMRSAVTLA